MAGLIEWCENEHAYRVRLDNGQHILVRRIKASDKPLIAKAIHDLSDQSRYFRFFAGFSDAPDSILNLLASVDGVKHIAWGAMDAEAEEERPIAAVHAFRGTEEAQDVEISTTVLDEYHGLGISHLLLAATAFDCINQDVKLAHAEVLPVNFKGQALFKGLDAELSHHEDVLHFQMNMDALLEKIESKAHPDSLAEFMQVLRRSA